MIPVRSLQFPGTARFQPVSPLHPADVSIFPLPVRRPVPIRPFVGMALPSFHAQVRPSSPCMEFIGDCGFGRGFGIGSPFFFNPFFFDLGPECFFDGIFEPCGFGPFGALGYGDLGYGYDFGNGYFYNTDQTPPPPLSNPDEEEPELAYPTYATPFLPVPYSEPAQPVVQLVLKDGTIFGVFSYWLEDGQLDYVTTYNIQTSIPIDVLDLQKTVDLNYKRGITFTLTPKPPQSPQPPDTPQPPGN